MKHYFSWKVLTLALGLVVSGPVLWAQLAPSATPAAVHFFEVGRLDFHAILPPPPEAGSLAAQADLETVQRAQLMRGAADIEWARTADHAISAFSDAAVLGDWFTKDNLPGTAAFLENVRRDMDDAIKRTKDLFSRPRPPLVDAGITPCVPLPKSYSYPSGHATRAYVWAGVMSDIFPEKRAELEAYASKICWGRIIGGVHFPTDVAGGHRMAEALLKELRQNPAFQAAVKKARAEADEAVANAKKKAAAPTSM